MARAMRANRTVRLRAIRPAFLQEKARAMRRRILCPVRRLAAPVDIVKPYKVSRRTLGDYVTLDWQHSRDIFRLKRAIRQYAGDATRARPLNIVMLAEPGSGKSHFIKCLAEDMDGVSAVTCNMTALQSSEDLAQALDAVRNLKVVDELPLLFLDEFDTSPGHYAMLLPLLWDGELQVGHRDLKVGKIVIIMAGSNKAIPAAMDLAQRMVGAPPENGGLHSPAEGKLPDLLSRVNGGVLKIPELDLCQGTRDRRVDKVCVAVSLLQRRFGADLQLVPWSLLHFVGLARFRYGVRSIAHLTDLIPPVSEAALASGRLPHRTLLGLPLSSTKGLVRSSLAYHLVCDGGPEEIISLYQSAVESTRMVRVAAEPSEEGL